MLVVIAEKEELKLVEELGYSKYPVLITGVGGMNVIRALKDLPRDTEILNIGYCGSKYYELGKRLEISRVLTNHEKAKFYEEEEYLIGCFKKCDDATVCYTSTDFVTETNKTKPCVFDMELAFICSMFDNVSSIKIVSDNLNKKEYDKKTKGE